MMENTASTDITASASPPPPKARRGKGRPNARGGDRPASAPPDLGEAKANDGAPPQAGGEALTPAEREAAITRLADMPISERAAARASEAARLGMTRTNLDKAINAAVAERRAKAAAAARIDPEPPPGAIKWPPGISPRPDGLYADTGDDAPPLWLAQPFDVLGKVRDAASEGWGLLLRWRDCDAQLHSWILPARLLVADPGAMEAELVSRAFHLNVDPGARMRLRGALNDVRVGNRVRLAHRAGWQGAAGGPFLMPDGEVIGASAETWQLDGAPETAARLCATAGTLGQWQASVAALAVGNPLAAFCLSAALVGPLLLPLGVPGGGIHLDGGSKRGKTLAAQMGLSCWGLPYKAGGLRDWNATANAFETVAEDCNDMLLVLDELHQANPADVARACYTLADGAGKTRLNREAAARRVRTWRTFIISTGEHDIATATTRAGQRLPAGADVRMPSLSVPEPVEAWPHLHGRDSHQALWGDLHRALPVQHGTAARAFLARLTAEDAGTVRTMAEAMRDRFDSALPADADPQVREVARRFALVATAGALATLWGVFPWPEGEAEQAAKAMLGRWLQRRPGGAQSGERAAHIERARLFLTLHGASRFTALIEGLAGGWVEADAARPVANRAGWRRRRGGRDEFLIPPEIWKAEICAPAALDARAMAQTLVTAGYLRTGEQGRPTVKERVPGMDNPARFYALSAALLEAQSGEAEAGTG